MKHLLITIAAVVLVGCGESQQSTPSPEVKPAEPVAEATKPEPPTAIAPDISFHDAVGEGNIEAVKQHLAAGVDVNSKDDIGDTALHIAAILGHKEVIALLIANDADVNAKNNDITPLDNAEDETANLLRKSGGKTNEELEADEKVISIHDAAIYGNIAAIKKHLADGANVNAREFNAWTPLHYATANSRKETVELLVINGADVNAKTTDDITPLHHSASNGDKEIVKLLIASGTDVSVKASNGITPLHKAALYSDKEISGLLIDKGADVNSKDDDGATPLHGAAFHGHKEVVEILISKGADVNVNAKLDDCVTPLDVAKKMKKTEIADLLRKHGGKTGEELKAEGK